MLLFLILLILAGAAVAFYANWNTGVHDITIWQWHWSGVADWVPVAVAAALVAVVFLLWMAYAGLITGVRHGSLRRRISSYEAVLADLRKENLRLREENSQLRGEMRGIDHGVAVASTAAAPGYSEADLRAERAEMRVPDRSWTAEPFRPRPTFGERMRAFFSGRERAGY